MVSIRRYEATEDRWCWCCGGLGINDPTIMKGEEYMMIVITRSVPPFPKREYSWCMDCFEREQAMGQFLADQQ